MRHMQAVALSAARSTRTIGVMGGAGFIGAHLCEALIEAGDSVVCVDNFHTGRRANVEPLVAAGLRIVEHDIVEPLPDELPRFDAIYNLACPASPPQYQEDPVRTALTCAQGAMTVLDRARRDGARVLQASTSEVYGDPEEHPQSESYHGNVNPVGPRSCYDEGKRFAETVFTDFGRSRGVDVRIARIFNTYGPRMQADDGRVVSNFVNQALRGLPITLYGEGEQTRSFCFVSDLVDGLIRLMDAPSPGAGPVNLGNPSETTVRELARRIVDLTGSSSPLELRPLPVDDPRRRCPDIARAQGVLGWSPRVGLASGLKETIAFFAEALRQEAAPAAAGELALT